MEDVRLQVISGQVVVISKVYHPPQVMKKKAVSKIAHGKLAKSAVFKGKKDSKAEGGAGKPFD